MTIETVAFSQLDPDLIASTYTEVQERVQEDNQDMDLRLYGPFAAYLIRYNALLGAQRLTNINAYLQAQSLLAISQDPTLSDPDLVDSVISNFRVIRMQGTPATGEVTVIVNSDVSTTIAKGSIWMVGTVQFTADQVFTGKLDAGQINSTGDRVYTPTADGNFAFTITVTAVNAGALAVSKDTMVAPTVTPVNYVNSYAAQDFTPGTDTETNADLLARLQTGIAAPTFGNRVNMLAMLLTQPAFANLVNQSIIGMGDPEMSRDRHSIFPVSMGGRCDWYIRTQQTIFRQALTKSATLVSVDVDGGGGVWQATLDRDEAAGLYEMANIRVTGDTSSSGGFTVVSDVRTLDLTGAIFVPDIVTVAEGMYSRFLSAVIQFHDTETSYATLAVGATALYDLEARGLPLIADLQDYVSGRDVNSYGTDCLVRAPIPCIVTLSLTIHKRSGDPDPDVTSIAAAIATAVNLTPFEGRLFASALQDVIVSFLAADQKVSSIDMLGRLLYPDRSTHYLHDEEVLIVPDEPAAFVTARTVQFFLDPSDVAITIATTVPPKI